MKHVNQSLVNAPKKIRLEKQLINCCWEGRINYEEVSGHKETKEKDNETGSSKYENEKANKVENELNLNVDEQ